jgi:hypothetical protein
MRLLLALGVVLCATPAFAQEAEYKQKLQDDLNVYVKDFAEQCGASVKIDWVGGKLGKNPREPESKGGNSVSVLCTCGLEAAFQSCADANVKKQLAQLTEVKCGRGKGALSYSHNGKVLTINIDPSFVTTTPPEQRDALKAKITKDKS